MPFQKQSTVIFNLLANAGGEWVPLPEILDLGIAQYNSRILELRRAGHRIENRTESIDGVRHSWFRLVPNREDADVQNRQYAQSYSDEHDCKATLTTSATPSTFLSFEMGRSRGGR